MLGCSRGWIRCWTEAERAGLKAMGLTYATYKAADKVLFFTLLFVMRQVIRAYVKAARDKKGEM